MMNMPERIYAWATPHGEFDYETHDDLKFVYCNEDEGDGPVIVYIMANRLPTAPEPDWSQAPEWAEWWAVDGAVEPCENSNSCWFENEPTQGDNATWWITVERGMSQSDRVVDLPIGIDWRTTLRKRPEGE